MMIPKTGKLIRGIVYNINSYITDRINPYGIKQGQFEYFMLIHENKGINQNTLANIKGVGKASVTKALKVLEKQEYIERRLDETDKRNYSLYCTNKGENIISDLISFQGDAEESVFKGFTDIEKSELIRLLEKMKKNTDELSGGNNG